MDIITLLGLIGSILTIVSSLISIIPPIISILKGNSTNSTLNNSTHNSIYLDNSITQNNTIQYKNIYYYKNSDSTNSSEDIFKIIAIFCFLFGGFIIGFYLSYLDTIFFYASIALIICYILNLISLYILNLKNLLRKLDIVVLAIIWLPIFLQLEFVHHVYFKSDNLIKAEQLIETLPSASKFLNIAYYYPHEVAFLSLQILGLILTLYISLCNIFYILKQLYKGIRYNSLIDHIDYKYIFGYIFILLLSFILISGFGITMYLKYMPAYK